MSGNHVEIVRSLWEHCGQMREGWLLVTSPQCPPPSLCLLLWPLIQPPTPLSPRSLNPLAVTCDGSCAGGGDSLGIVGFTWERRCLVQAWGGRGESLVLQGGGLPHLVTQTHTHLFLGLFLPQSKLMTQCQTSLWKQKQPSQLSFKFSYPRRSHLWICCQISPCPLVKIKYAPNVERLDGGYESNKS